MGYVVTAPLVIVRDETGSSHHFYEGASVPDGMDKDHLEQLLEDGMIEKAQAEKPEPDEEPAAEPDEEPAAEPDEEPGPQKAKAGPKSGS